MLSNTCKYAVRAVIYLASGFDGDHKYGIKKISEDLKIPSPFLGKILQKLVKSGVLNSNKGPNGGFCLAKDPNLITLFDVVNVIDGKAFFEQCLICDMTCSEREENDDFCAIHLGFKEIRESITNLFKNKTIGELLDDANNDQTPASLRF
ncbi:MAG: RrF2 family transcriptional regulator [Prolixibacteraceae bacterium]|jgi:Rrf2 family protein|nr:Rrf2 family transcriptional regulator [Prolixibacteraceae bacterium]